MSISTFVVPCGINSTPQTIDNTFWNYTKFQIQFMQEVQKRVNFQHFIAADHNPKFQKAPRKAGVTCVLWAENGNLHSTRVGCERVVSPEIVAVN